MTRKRKRAELPRATTACLSTWLLCCFAAVLALTANGYAQETLTVTVNGGGTVKSFPAGISCPGTCSYSFTSGATVTLTPTASVGYAFTGWAGACSGTGTCRLTMSSAESVTATFTAEPAQTLTLTVVGSGTVTTSPAGISCPGTCSASYPYGTKVTLTATPATDYYFVGYTGGTTFQTVTMTAAENVTATFAPLTLTIVVTGNGTVVSSPAGISCPGTCSASFALGTAVTFTATPSAGYNFSGWGWHTNYAPCSGIGTCSFTTSTASTIYAGFDQPYITQGYITTLAGDGEGGTLVNGGPAISANLSLPVYGDFVDSQGNIYLVAAQNEIVAKVAASTGDLTIVAGNGTRGYNGDGIAATSAELAFPEGVTVDSSGNIYIADSANCRIRKVTASSGLISTIAGNGTCGYSGDLGLATSAEINGVPKVTLDSAGNLYLPDGNNDRVRVVNTGTKAIKIDAVTIQPNYIATVAGTGTAGYNGDNIAATSAELDEPLSVALDASGHIFIADSDNERIRVVNTGSTSVTIAGVTIAPGDIGTVAGNGTAGYNGDNIAATSAELNLPYAVSVDTVGNIYIADCFNERIREVSATTNQISTIAGNGIVGFAGDGGLATGASMYSPTAVALDSAANVYVADSSNARIRVVGGANALGISYISPAAAEIGASVTIVGSNFGSTRGTVTFNTTKATSIATWTTTSITVTVPTGATTGNVVVTSSSGHSSNPSSFTVVLAPSITSLSSTSGAPGLSITITGANFGATQGTSAVLFNGTVGSPTSWANGSIAVPVPANASTGPVTVVVDGLTSNGITFTDTSAPVITTISPSSGTVSTSVTVNGSLFGSPQGSSTVTFNGQPGTPTSWVTGKIVVPAPAGVTTGNVVVTVNGIASNGVLFTAKPIISGLSPTSGGVGAAVTITGTNFGSTTPTVAFNGKAATPLTYSTTSIVVPVPSGATTGNVVVTVGGVASNGISFTVNSAPGITSISPSTAAVGTSVTLAGSGFGSPQGSSTVTFNGVKPTTIAVWNATTIQATVPAGGVPGPVVVTVGSLLSNPWQLLPPEGAPQITALSFTQGPPQMGFSITGTNFNANANYDQVTIGGTQVPILAAINNNGSVSLIVQVPAGAPVSFLDVVVLVGPGPVYTASEPVAFQVVDPPTCTLPLP